MEKYNFHEKSVDLLIAHIKTNFSIYILYTFKLLKNLTWQHSFGQHSISANFEKYFSEKYIFVWMLISKNIFFLNLLFLMFASVFRCWKFCLHSFLCLSYIVRIICRKMAQVHKMNSNFSQPFFKHSFSFWLIEHFFVLPCLQKKYQIFLRCKN